MARAAISSTRLGSTRVERPRRDSSYAAAPRTTATTTSSNTNARNSDLTIELRGPSLVGGRRFVPGQCRALG
jgi:hypothetical protein